MDRRLRKELEETLRGFTSPQDSGVGTTNDAPGLNPYLETVASLRKDARALPWSLVSDRSREQLLSSLRGREKSSGGVRGMILPQPAFVRVAGAITGFALLFGGIAGASAAAGGPDVTEQVQETLGISNAPEAASTGTGHANDNAFDGSDNAGQGIDNAAEAGQEHANDNASEGADNADQGSDNANDAADGDGPALNESADDNADDGSGNADDGSDNADDGSDNADDGSDNADDGSGNADDGLENADDEGIENSAEGLDTANSHTPIPVPPED